jgi:hypothetical protein
MADPQTEDLLEQVIAQLARVNGWSDAEELAQLKAALSLADRAERGDVYAKAQVDALLQSVGVTLRAPGQPGQAGEVAPGVPSVDLEEGWLPETEPGISIYNAADQLEPTVVNTRIHPTTGKYERWGYDQDGNWRRLSTESVPKDARTAQTRDQLAAQLGREPTEAEWSRTVLGFGSTASAAPPAQVRLLDQALAGGYISEQEYGGAIRSLALGDVDPTGMTAYQSASLAARRAELGQRQYEFGQTFGQRQREFEAQIELDRIETALRRDQAAIAAARTGNPLEYLALLRGQVPTVGTGETYQGFPRLVSPAVDPTQVGVLPREATAPTSFPAAPAVAAATPTTAPSVAAVPIASPTLATAAAKAARDEEFRRIIAGEPIPSAPLASAAPLASTPTTAAPATMALTATTPETAVAGGISPVRGLEPPVAPQFMQDIKAGLPLQRVGPPAGARFPGVQQQAAMTPAELAAFVEEKEFAGLSPLDIPFFLEQTRRGLGPGVRAGGFGGVAV